MTTDMPTPIQKAVDEISSTEDLLERSLKLAGLLTTMFGEKGFPLVVVGGSAVEFYTEGGYMSGDIDLCRTSLKAIPPRLMQKQKPSGRRSKMADATKTVIRLTWREWRESRDARRKALTSRGLSSPCRRTSAKPKALAAAESILRKAPCQNS